MVSSLRFLPMEPCHLPACTAIAAAAPDPWRPEDLESQLALGQPGFVALIEDVPSGFACFRREGDSADLALLAVDPPHRRQGVGGALLAHSLARLAEVGITRCLLEVRASNTPALALYRKLGFVKLADRRGLYSHPKEDGLLLEAVLRPNGLQTHYPT